MQTKSNQLGIRQIVGVAAFIALGLVFFGYRGCGNAADTQSNVPPVYRTPVEVRNGAEDAKLLSVAPLKRFAEGKELSEDDKRDLRKAGALFEGLINAEPDVVHPYVGAGMIYRALGADDKAELFLTRAVTNGQDAADTETKLSVAEAHYHLALIQSAKRNFQQALDEATQAVSAVPNSPNYLAARAGAYIQLNDVEHAKADIKEALRLDPANRQARGLFKMISLAGQR